MPLEVRRRRPGRRGGRGRARRRARRARRTTSSEHAPTRPSRTHSGDPLLAPGARQRGATRWIERRQLRGRGRSVGVTGASSEVSGVVSRVARASGNYLRHGETSVGPVGAVDLTPQRSDRYPRALPTPSLGGVRWPQCPTTDRPTPCATSRARWLAEHLPAGWMEAVDARRRRRRARRCRGGSTTPNGASSSARRATRRPTWPAEYGAGLSLSPGDASFVNEVLNHYKVPRPYNIIGIGMGGPTVMAWGTEEMKHRLLKPARLQPGDLVPAVQRARRGLGRRRPRDACGARRRRVGRQRPEGLDDGRAPLEVGDAAVPHRTPTCRSTAGSRTSSSTWSSPASRCGRSCRSPVTPSSTRCSSTTPGSATTGCSVARATAGRSRSRRS